MFVTSFLLRCASDIVVSKGDLESDDLGFTSLEKCYIIHVSRNEVLGYQT